MLSVVRNMAEALAGAPYKWEQGPAQVTSIEVANAEGLNCVALSHLVLRELGARLSPDLHCYEMWKDLHSAGRSLRPVAGIHALQEGDIVLFGLDYLQGEATLEGFSPRYNDDGFLTNYNRNPLRHMAITTVEQNQAGEPLVLHANHHTGVEITTLTEVMQIEEHAKVYGIGRAIG